MIGEACTAYGVGRGAYRALLVKPGVRDHWGYSGVIGKIILRWIFSKWNVGERTGSWWFKIGIGFGHL